MRGQCRCAAQRRVVALVDERDVPDSHTRLTCSRHHEDRHRTAVDGPVGGTPEESIPLRGSARRANYKPICTRLVHTAEELIERGAASNLPAHAPSSVLQLFSAPLLAAVGFSTAPGAMRQGVRASLRGKPREQRMTR